MPDLTIREAGKPDLPAVLAPYAQPDFNDGRVVSVEEGERLLDTFARYPDGRLYLAETGGEPVGTFRLPRIDNIAHRGMAIGMVESVTVSDRHRRAGIGRAIRREAARLAEAKGRYKPVLSSNVRSAHAFCESLGFERYGYSFRPGPAVVRDEEIAA